MYIVVYVQYNYISTSTVRLCCSCAENKNEAYYDSHCTLIVRCLYIEYWSVVYIICTTNPGRVMDHES